MTIRFTDGDELPEDYLGLAEELFRKAKDDVEAALASIRKGEHAAAKDGKVASQHLVDFGVQIMKGRANVERFRKQASGLVGAGNALDLDAARDEIGRRLALLRNTRGD